MAPIVQRLQSRIFARLGLVSLVAATTACDTPDVQRDSAQASRHHVDPAAPFADGEAVGPLVPATGVPGANPVLSVSALAVQHDVVLTVVDAPPLGHVRIDIDGLPNGSWTIELQANAQGLAVWEGLTGPAIFGGEQLDFRAETGGLFTPEVHAIVEPNVCAFDTVARAGMVDVLTDGLLIRAVDDLNADGSCDPIADFHIWRGHDMLVDDFGDLIPDNFVFTPLCEETSIVDGCAYVIHIEDLNGVGNGNDCWWCGLDYLGRPFTVGAECRRPLPTRDPGWADPTLLELADVLPRRVRRRLARMWAKQATEEHTSIASFARLTLELLALGAPAELVTGATSAQADEIRHARDAFAVASHLAGAQVGPGRIAIAGSLDDRDVRTILLSAVTEGCLNETVCAALALKGAETATDPHLARQMRAVADDETRHAELSWALVQWILQRHPHLADDVAGVLSNYSIGPRPTEDPDADWLARAGQVCPAVAHDLAVQVLRDVIRPTMAALVGEARQAA